MFLLVETQEDYFRYPIEDKDGSAVALVLAAIVILSYTDKDIRSVGRVAVLLEDETRKKNERGHELPGHASRTSPIRKSY